MISKPITQAFHATQWLLIIGKCSFIWDFRQNLKEINFSFESSSGTVSGWTSGYDYGIIQFGQNFADVVNSMVFFQNP